MRLSLTVLFIVFTSIGWTQNNFVGGELLILMNAQEDLSSFTEVFEEKYNTKIEEKQRLAQSIPLHLLSFDAEEVPTKEVLRFAQSSRMVSIAQLNHTDLKMRLTPNDASFDEQWHLFNDGTNGGSGQADMDALSAWDIATGGLTPGGDTIVVAVVDGGFNLSHPDLEPNFFVNHSEIPNNGIDDDNNGYIDDVSGWNVFNNSGSHLNDNHGNHVAGIIGAKGNNSEGVTGVNWNVKILPISGSSTNDATVAAAYGYILDMRKRYDSTNGAEGAYVVSTNASFGVDFGDPANFPLWCAMYDSLGYAGVISAGATANANYNIDVVGDVPTACASNFLLSVTNTTSNDTKNNSAAYGLTTIDLGAPGTSIYSTLSNGYGNLTGTSMATPQVAGAVALMYNALCPEIWQAYATNPAGLALFIKDKLMTEGVEDLNALNSITVSGGRLDLFKAVNSVADSCFAVVLDVTNTGCGDCDGSIVPNVLGGTAPLTYLWSTGSTSAAGIDSLCTGQYTLTVVDALGDSAVASTSLSDSDGPLVNSEVVGVSCAGGADGQVTLTGAEQYIWSDGDSSSTRSDLSVGSYFVSAFDIGNPCTTIVSIDITEPEGFSVDITTAVPVPLTAANGSISLNVSGATPPYTYAWNNSGTGSLESGLSIGTYTVTIVDAQGCSESIDVLLGYPAGLEPTESDPVIVFPNPAHESLHVRYDGLGNARALLYDLTGRELIRGNDGSDLITLDLSALSSGAYVLIVQTPKGTFRRKIQHIQ